MLKIIISVTAVYVVALPAFASIGTDSTPKALASNDVVMAQTQGSDRRQDRRDDRQDDRDDRQEDRQDCRQEEGVGKDKRDCKQDERQDRNQDG